MDDEIEKQLQAIADMIAAALNINPGAVSFHVFDSREDVIEFIQKIEQSELSDLPEFLWDDDANDHPALCNLCHFLPPTPSSAFGYCACCMALMN